MFFVELFTLNLTCLIPVCHAVFYAAVQAHTSQTAVVALYLFFLVDTFMIDCKREE